MKLKIGFYPIVGDCLHAGHILAMKEAKDNCDFLIVGMNCAPDGKEPIQSVYERFIQLDGVMYADKIIPYAGRSDMETLVSSLDYDIRFVGSDYIDRDWDGKSIERALGKEVYFLSRNHSMSSTSLKDRIVSRWKEDNLPKTQCGDIR